MPVAEEPVVSSPSVAHKGSGWKTLDTGTLDLSLKLGREGTVGWT